VAASAGVNKAEKASRDNIGWRHVSGAGISAWLAAHRVHQRKPAASAWQQQAALWLAPGWQRKQAAAGVALGSKAAWQT